MSAVDRSRGMSGSLLDLPTSEEWKAELTRCWLYTWTLYLSADSNHLIVEPTTSQSLVRRPNRHTNKPPLIPEVSLNAGYRRRRASGVCRYINGAKYPLRHYASLTFPPWKSAEKPPSETRIVHVRWRYGQDRIMFRGTLSMTDIVRLSIMLDNCI